MIAIPELGLNGRLGNQLWQFGAAFAHAKRTYQSFVVPRYGLTEQFDLPPGTSAVPRDAMPSLPNHYREASFAYTKIPETVTDSTISGYFQSYRYLEGAESDIYDCFLGTCNAYGAGIYAVEMAVGDAFRGDVVAVGVRRTDYLTSNGFHAVQPMEYYDRAMATFANSTFLIFSDDMPWCKENFRQPNVRFCEEADPWVKLWAMAACDHHIIAASTYHWWGAWLCGTPNRVIWPKQWFGPAGPNELTDDISPPDWIRM